jgi:hypothetical protein
MEFVSKENFVQWAEQHNIEINPRNNYGLDFTVKGNNLRYYYPDNPRGYCYLISEILKAFSGWDKCWIWKRYGRWRFDEVKGGELHDPVWAALIHKLGVPDNYSGAIVFDKSEFSVLMAILFVQMSFGWSLPDDVFLISSNAREIVYFDHDEAIHIAFKDNVDMEGFSQQLEKMGIVRNQKPT